VRLEAADPSWIDERFERSQREGAAPVRVLFMGGDFVRKGGPELLEAWAAAGLAGRAELTLVTDWPIAIDRLPPGVRVQRGLRAYTPAWQAAWRDADLFALPTRGEAFGMVLQEAAAAGLPVVATRLNAIPELVVDGTTGLLVPSGDRAALAAALAALVGSPEQRRAMGAAARRRIERVGDAARYAAALTGLVRAAASRKGAS
jgi:glycosyltransferase involved in cell wall biosynthesis